MTPDVSQWLASWASPLPLADVMHRIDLAQLDKDALSFVIETKDPLEIAGWIRVGRTCPDSKIAELSYWLGERFQGKGYALEAAREVLAAAWRHFDFEQVEAGAQLDHAASFAVMQKLGMEPIGERSFYAPVRNRHEPCLYYAALRPSP